MTFNFKINCLTNVIINCISIYDITIYYTLTCLGFEITFENDG